MNDWLPKQTEHKHTALAVTIFQLTISFHKEIKKQHIWLSIDNFPVLTALLTCVSIHNSDTCMSFIRMCDNDRHRSFERGIC